MEAACVLWFDVLPLLDEGFGVADDRGERRTQLMAGVCDEVGMGTADIELSGPVDQLDQRIALVERLAGHLPTAARAGQALHPGAATTWPREQLNSLRMTKRNPRVLANDMGAKRFACGGIGDQNTFTIKHQHRQSAVLDQLAHTVRRELDSLPRRP